MLRITTGTAKNKRLISPDVPGYRAVQEVAKLALFSIIGDQVEGATCLDLYAGSGNLGLEALSRGAIWCDFVDDNYNAIGSINENVQNCGFMDVSSTNRKDSVKYVASTEKKYDLIFLDPFYNDTALKFLFKNLRNTLNENGRICFFHGELVSPTELAATSHLVIETERKFGASFLTILKHA